jgi:Ca-activated chloride channel homolog
MTLSWVRPEALWWLALVPVLTLLPPLLLRRRMRLGKLRMALRTAIVALLVVAIAGPMVLRTGAESTTIFLMDRSGSVQDTSGDAAQVWMERAVDAAGPQQAVMIADFGGATERRAGPGQGGAIDTAAGDASAIDPGATDIQTALAESGALPIGGARVVLLSDGAETSGQAQREIETLRAAGIPVDVIPLTGIPDDELRLTGLSGPSVTWAGRDETITAYVDGGTAGSVPVELEIDGEAVERKDAALGGGTAVSFDLPALEPGFHVVQVRLDRGDLPDPVAANDAWPMGIVVREAPLIAIVSPEGGDSGRLKGAIEAEGFRTEEVASPALPGTVEDLDRWDAVVLNNVPAWDLQNGVQEALIDYTRAGGGVLVLGGTASYGPGAYASTPLESMLPVTVKVTDGRDRPRVAVLLVIDRSGSMAYGESTSGAPKIELARDGVVTAASALVGGDQVGVIAFNDEPVWALPMTTLEGENPEELIAESVSELHADGGTELFPAMQVAVDALRNVDADVRHIIILSDGRSRGAERDSYFRLLDDASASGITVSTLGLGYDADTALLEDIAAQGGGRYYYVENPDSIPRITFEEARAAGSQSVLRGSFTPVQLSPSPIMADVDAAAMPPLDGYNFAGARPGAQVVLASDRRDPLLVQWQFGLGRVVAWTGDSGDDFAAGWGSWDGYDAFWGNALSWALPDPANLQYEIAVTSSGNDATLAIHPAGETSPSRSDATVTVRDASGAVVGDPVRLSETNGAIAVPASGGPVWRVEIDDGGEVETQAAALTPGAEWQPAPGGGTLLRSIADQTGGRELSLEDDPATIFDAGTLGAGRQEAVGVWWVPALAALSVFLADIALRLGVTFRKRPALGT